MNTFKLIIGSIFLLVCTCTMNADVIDLGYIGNTQSIAEESLEKKLIAATNEFNATKRKEEFIKSIHKIGDGVLGFPLCDVNLTRTVIPGTTLTKDYFTPDGRMIAKKGTVINPLNKFEGTVQPVIVIFDGTSKKHIAYIKSYCKNKTCMLSINKGNSFDLKENYDIDAYPMPKLLTDVLTARCSLSTYEIVGNGYKITEISLENKDEE